MSAPDQKEPGHSVDARVARTHHDVVGVALRVLVDEGWESFTLPRVAQEAGYSKATLYKHWPTRTHLLRDAVLRLGDIPHHTPTGDLRADLIAELTAFRDGMTQAGLDRALAVLVEHALWNPVVAALRDETVADGERVMRQLLGTVFAGAELDAAVLMLSGATLYSALVHGRIPQDEVITTTVDLVLRGAGTYVPA